MDPPGGAAPIRLDRFSPHFDKAATFGFTNVQPYPCYRFIYPLPVEVVQRLAYFFTSDYRDPSQRGFPYAQPLFEAILAWRQAAGTSELFFVEDEQTTLICDLRPHARQQLYVLQGLERMLYRACDAIQPLSALLDIARPVTGEAAAATVVETCLTVFQDHGLIVADGNSFLALALDATIYELSVASQDQLRRAIDDATISLVDDVATLPAFQTSRIREEVMSIGSSL